MTITEKSPRPAFSREKAPRAAARQHTQHIRDMAERQTPAPVDGGLAMLHGPLMHPDSAPAVWREYGKPPAAPWGSYLDERPLPRHPDGRGPFETAIDAQEAHS